MAGGIFVNNLGNSSNNETLEEFQDIIGMGNVRVEGA